MKKAGEQAKKFFVHALFVFLIVASVYFISTHAPSITGHAVLNASSAKAKLESALASSSLFSLVSSASICVVINDATQPLSLQAVKDSTGWTVSEMKDFCSGSNYEDFVVQFADYDSFSEVVDTPSPRNIASAAEDGDFEILPSKYVELGGNVLCDATFNAQYCTAAKTLASDEKLIEADLSCCISEMTRAQRKLLETHLQSGGYKDEQKVLEQPATVAGLSMTMIGTLGGGLLLVIILIIVFALKGHGSAPSAKPAAARPAAGGAAGAAGAVAAGFQAAGAAAAMPSASMPGAGMPPAEDPQITGLRNYVVGAMAEGYTWDQVRTHLLEIGWDQGTADKIVREAYDKLQQQTRSS